jgi:hypothetical protein
MALAVHHIPYKALGRCGVEELAADQAARNRREAQLTGGVSFARKEFTSEKGAARREIRHLLTTQQMPGPISVLSMPGLAWTFEYDVLAQRDSGWTKTRDVQRTRFFCVENDRYVYYSAATKMPGSKHKMTVRTLERPAYAETAIGNSAIGCFAFANVDDLMAEGRETFDVAWLDYTGPLTVDRLKLIERFYRDNVRSTLIVTSLKARWNKDTDRAAQRHGGYCEWAVAPFGDSIGLHAIEYQDGPSPMFQFACRKVPQ